MRPTVGPDEPGPALDNPHHRAPWSIARRQRPLSDAEASKPFLCDGRNGHRAAGALDADLGGTVLCLQRDHAVDTHSHTASKTMRNAACSDTVKCSAIRGGRDRKSTRLN